MLKRLTTSNSPVLWLFRFYPYIVFWSKDVCLSWTLAINTSTYADKWLIALIVALKQTWRGIRQRWLLPVCISIRAAHLVWEAGGSLTADEIKLICKWALFGVKTLQKSRWNISFHAMMKNLMPRWTAAVDWQDKSIVCCCADVSSSEVIGASTLPVAVNQVLCLCGVCFGLNCLTLYWKATLGLVYNTTSCSQCC